MGPEFSAKVLSILLLAFSLCSPFFLFLFLVGPTFCLFPGQTRAGIVRFPLSWDRSSNRQFPKSRAASPTGHLFHQHLFFPSPSPVVVQMASIPSNPNDPNRQGPYPPHQWSSTHPEDKRNQPYAVSHYPYPPTSYPLPSYPPGAYPPSAEHAHQYPPPPPPQYPPPNVGPVHPPMQAHQDAYRLPPPPAAYPYAQPPPQPQVVYQTAAPRQRTAIACRYCRRRKIRCSGFDSSSDGRCSNCIRFNQECLFTPVSSQTQAFVPAHAAYPHLRNAPNGRPPHGVAFYGAHGQPLPPQHVGQPETLHPPQAMYQLPYSRPPNMDGGAHPPTLIPPISQDQRPRGRRGSVSSYEYPDPTNLAPVTPAGSTAGYQAHGAPSPYYPPPPHDRRASPHPAYSYDGRHSTSPHSSPYPAVPPNQAGVTPPPTSSAPISTRAGLGVRDMLNPGDQSQTVSNPESQGRSSTDSDMLNQLNRRGLDK